MSYDYEYDFGEPIDWMNVIVRCSRLAKDEDAVFLEGVLRSGQRFLTPMDVRMLTMIAKRLSVDLRPVP